MQSINKKIGLVPIFLCVHTEIGAFIIKIVLLFLHFINWEKIKSYCEKLH